MRRRVVPVVLDDEPPPVAPAIEKTDRECRCCEQMTLGARGKNKWSRFVNVYICTGCAWRETQEGFFWRKHAESRALDIRETPR